MVKLTVATVALLILVTLVLAIVISVFLIGIQASPLEARRTFSEGCLTYCSQIEQEAQDTGDQVAIVAVRKADELRETSFIQACNRLFPGTQGFPWLCWNRGSCCNFQLPETP